MFFIAYYTYVLLNSRKILHMLLDIHKVEYDLLKVTLDMQDYYM